MSEPVVECPNCAARIRSHEARFCEYCGTALPQPEVPTRTRGTEIADHFRALREHPDLPQLLARKPSAAQAVGADAGPLIMAVLGGIVVVVFLTTFMNNAPSGGFFTLIPVLMIGFVLVAIVRSAARTTHVASSPMRRKPAIVVGERTDVTGGGDNRRARTTHYVTFEFETGEREELRIGGRLAGMLARDDAGVAYLKGDRLVDFKRVRV